MLNLLLLELEYPHFASIITFAFGIQNQSKYIFNCKIQSNLQQELVFILELSFNRNIVLGIRKYCSTKF